MKKVIGPGSLNVDITGYAPRLPVAGETVKGTRLRFGPGGKGSNQMVAAHRAGADARLIACRGNDFLGGLLHDFFKENGISEQYVTVRDDAETASALIEVDECDAQNRIIVVLSANELVGREAVYAAEKDFADCGAVLTQFETTLEAVVGAKELAQKYNKPFILNPAPYLPMPASLYEGVDYLTPNETEASALTGLSVQTKEDCRGAAGKLLQMGVKHAIITLGAKGVYFLDADQKLFVPALKVDAVDTTGAGDAFNGGFAAAVADGLDAETALKFATCTAALSVTRPGAAPAMPERKETLALLKKEFGITIE